jgi:hypothetical protein
MDMLLIKSENGTGLYTKFIDKETGENLGEKLSIGFGATITIGKIVTADLRLALIELEIETEVVNYLMPNPARNKKLMAISNLIFKNGDKINFEEDGSIKIIKNEI